MLITRSYACRPWCSWSIRYCGSASDIFWLTVFTRSGSDTRSCSNT
ncbi:hypothetical protein PROSTU_04069 [Providencia stuartii ATCC 25827]|uniref:Uncharacterized protein n=1 Tax=Providencia stuartii ATCC 25827 TaxID=471874 RepID=A0AA86YX18_PROST|nr:hypothetical protein PROSTU_04069 [Providencia stuartii ATCC 25827]